MSGAHSTGHLKTNVSYRQQLDIITSIIKLQAIQCSLSAPLKCTSRFDRCAWLVQLSHIIQMSLTFTHKLYADINCVYRYCNSGISAVLSKLWKSTLKYFKMYTEFWHTHSFPQGNAICVMGREGDVLSAVWWSTCISDADVPQRLVFHGLHPFCITNCVCTILQMVGRTTAAYEFILFINEAHSSMIISLHSQSHDCTCELV